MKIKLYGKALPYVLISPEAPDGMGQDLWERITILFNTRPGTQALDREYGIDWPIDELTPRAMALCEAEVVQKMRRYLEGIDIRDITWEADGEGRIFMKVVTYLV